MQVERFLADFQRSDSTQIVVLTVPSLEGEDLEGYTVRVAQSWGIGQKGKDNGALLLVAKAERAVRIEVGYGLEDRLTDLLAGRIVDQEIVPRFKSGDYDGGIRAGVQALAGAVRGAYKGDNTRQGKKQSSPYSALLWLLFLGPGLLRMFAGGSARGARRGGGFYGGGFGSGGGFGGGRGRLQWRRGRFWRGRRFGKLVGQKTEDRRQKTEDRRQKEPIRKAGRHKGNEKGGGVFPGGGERANEAAVAEQGACQPAARLRINHKLSRTGIKPAGNLIMM